MGKEEAQGKGYFTTSWTVGSFCNYTLTKFVGENSKIEGGG